MAPEEGATCGSGRHPLRINTSCFLIRWRDGLHWDSPKPTAESQRSRSDTRLPTARPGSDHVGMSSLGNLGGGEEGWPRLAVLGEAGTVRFL